jgi:hypothetical protein
MLGNIEESTRDSTVRLQEEMKRWGFFLNGHLIYLFWWAQIWEEEETTGYRWSEIKVRIERWVFVQWDS